MNWVNAFIYGCIGFMLLIEGFKRIHSSPVELGFPKAGGFKQTFIEGPEGVRLAGYIVQNFCPDTVAIIFSGVGREDET